ncbi:MAG: hypothetical protein VB118_00205 [Oscillospiraceae bacterium]|nr:hypothetical protein [Oscillospiraceae bacterium]
MELKHYADYISIPEGYRANMTREAINETPDTWLDFYPHKRYIEFLQTLLDGIKTGGKSVWLTGNYGTGKSNASLVTQKLFMDEEERVRRWFEEKKKSMSDRDSLEAAVFACRKEGTLVIYDYNASGVGPNEEFLVRLEKGIIATLKERGMVVPSKGNLDIVISRLEREGQHFFDTRDRIQSSLAYLHSGITITDQLIATLKQADSASDAQTHLLDDVQTVLHEDNIFLNMDVNTFRQWITAIRKENHIERVIYIFDEFSEFVEENIAHLKTFEEVTEAPGINRFYLVPVTHLKLDAFWSETSATAGRAEERFYTRNLQMPNDTAFRLAHNAIHENPDPKAADKWKEEKDILWQSVSAVAGQFSNEVVSNQSFYDILPIHPMAAFLLKHLSESARSNQRSIFEYLKGSADGREFQDFIRSGGPGIPNKQFLTVDYLWKYFIERDDLSINKEIVSIRSEYERIKMRDFQNRSDDDEEIRVLKAVLLFCLLSRLNPDGDEKLRPTVRNVELSFQGDGAMINIRGIIYFLRDKHCFSVVNDNIELYASSVQGVDLQNKIKELEPKFDELISTKVNEALTKHTQSARIKHSANRFDIRVSDVNHTTLTYIQASTRAKYSEGQTQNRDNGSICLWYVIAKNKAEQLLIPEKIETILKQLRDHRIMFFTFPESTFCGKNSEMWSEYVTQYAQYLLENNDQAKRQIKTAYERIECEWCAELKNAARKLRCYTVVNGAVISQDLSWSEFSTLISDYEKCKLPGCVDCLTVWVSAYSEKGLKSWANAGIQYNAASDQFKQLVDVFKKQGITLEDTWYTQNPNHPLARIKALFDKKIANTLSKGSSLSVRKVYIELQCAPFGMKNNVLSAFVLGCVLRGLLDKNYQWENGQMNHPLDADTLSEIIETVVKDDGQDNIKLEKLICRLSKEQRAFIEYAPKMFGCIPIQDTTLSNTLLQIQSKVEEVSHRVPLWILPAYIRSNGADNADKIDSILRSVCDACVISSKGKAEEKTAAIESIGQAILANTEIVYEISQYIQEHYFVLAFQQYVDQNAPSLKALAESLGDNSHAYCDSILDKARISAGILWNQTDIGREIDETASEYHVIQMAQLLYDMNGFSTYKEVRNVLSNAVQVINKVPATMLQSAFPSIGAFIKVFQKGEPAAELAAAMENIIDTIKALFFDTKKTASIKIIRDCLSVPGVEDRVVMEILNNTNDGFSSSEGAFITSAMQKLTALQKASVEHNLIEEWKRLSQVSSPDIWAQNNNVPAYYLLGHTVDATSIISAVQNPGTFSTDKLSEYLDFLHTCQPLSIADCQIAFKKEAVPSRYAKFEIGLASLLAFMHSRYGDQPNRWPRKPDLNDFISDQYKCAIAPQIVEKIQGKSPESLKDILLKMARNNPEVGLLFWEDDDGIHR